MMVFYCIDCNIKLKSTHNPKRCVPCNNAYKKENFKHSDETKLKISINKKKIKEPKFCTKCQKEISYRNKSGICHPCSRGGKWYSGLIINNLEFLSFLCKKGGYEYWNIKCFCGNIFQTTASRVKRNRCESCGCLNKEHCKKIGSEQKGYNNPVWIEDRTKTSLFIRKYNFNRNIKGSWQHISRKYKIKQNFICEVTGEKCLGKGTLHVHHIESVTLNPNLVIEDFNLICVKKEIHLLFHKKYGKKTNREQWEDFIHRYYNIHDLNKMVA